MCAMSMIPKMYDMYPTLYNFNWPVPVPASPPWTPEAFTMLKDILAKVDTLDKKLGLVKCEDPKKTEWMKTIEDRLEQLERAQ